MNRLLDAKKSYEEIEIPDELSNIVAQAIAKSKQNATKSFRWKPYTLGIVASAFLFISGLNISPAFAQSMAGVPGLGKVISIFTIHEITFQEDNYQADLKAPGIDGLTDKTLQNGLNTKYLEESKARFAEFQNEMAEMKEVGDGHLGVASGYEVVTETDQLLSIKRYVVEIQASGYETVQYDTIDKENNLFITLPSLFKDNHYIDTINTFITNEMERQMATDESISYFINEGYESDFTSIHAEQDFYISNENQLVISFDEYEVAPGFMGVVTFEIPTEVLKPYLINNLYIK